jgi:hypothetical protein
LKVVKAVVKKRRASFLLGAVGKRTAKACLLDVKGKKQNQVKDVLVQLERPKKIDLTLLKVLHWPELSVKGGRGGRVTCQVESTAGIVDPPGGGRCKKSTKVLIYIPRLHNHD